MESGLIMKQRGFKTEVGSDPDAPFDSIFSGNVVEMCPVGALTAKSFRFVGRPWELRRTPSICGNCSVGCNVMVDVRVDKVQRQYARTNDDIDDGWLCDRGRWGLDALNSPQRLRTPLIRREGTLQPASWNEAVALVGNRLREVAQHSGPQAVGGIGSTHTTNEEAYLFQKLLRAGIGSNNVDHFHGDFATTAPNGLPWVWTGSIAGLDAASHIVLLGTNTYQRQPIVDLRVRKAIRAGAQLYVLTPEPTRFDRLATQVMRYRPGHTGTVARALLALIQSEGLARGDGVARQGTANADPNLLAEQAGVAPEALRAVARALSSARAATVLYDEMATREPSGSTLAADILQVALVTDNVGRPGAGAGPLFEDVNSLGARDMGLLPDLLPGYLPVGEDAGRRRLSALWGGSELPAQPGLTYAAMLAGGVKALYVVGANPAAHVDPSALDGLDFLVVQDLFLTETAQRADVVLPAVAYTEKDGSFTNTERCIQAVRRAMVPLPGARADWEILQDVARAVGMRWNYRSAGDVLSEIGQAVPLYGGLTRRGLGTKGVRWPVAGAAGAGNDAAGPGTSYLTVDMVRDGLASVQRPVEPTAAGRGE